MLPLAFTCASCSAWATLLVALLVGWLMLNLLVAIWFGVRRRLWERRIRRGADGVLADAAPYTVGNGATALLLIHGFADSPAVFRELAAELAAKGLACRVMRMPGACEPRAVAARQSPATWLAAVRAEVAVLRATHRQVWLLGHSMGGLSGAARPARRPCHGRWPYSARTPDQGFSRPCATTPSTATMVPSRTFDPAPCADV
jgi:carboxylesterase